MTKIKLGAITLALLVSTALPVETPLVGDFFGSPPAQADVWGKVKGAAKKVGGAGKFVGKATAGMAKDAGKLGWESYKGYSMIVGGAVVNGAKGVGRGAKAAWNGVVIPPKPDKPAPLVGKPLPKPPAGKPGSWGGQTSN